MLEEKPPLDELAHFGVMGMHWGVHRALRDQGVPLKTSKQAMKDAHEFARAKMFYGEGAGTRRKLIKASVEGKAKKDPAYQKAFDHHLANQDMSEHAAKARSERGRKNAVKSTAKTARGIKNVILGNAQYASLAAVMIGGGAMYAHKHGIDKVVFNSAKKAYKNVSGTRIKAGMPASDFLRSMGIHP